MKSFFDALSERLRRLLGRGDVTGGGDAGVKISGGNVTVAGDLVGGNKITNIILRLPAPVLIGLVVGVVVIAVAVWWILTPGQMPAGNANVAIVDFGVMNADGTGVTRLTTNDSSDSGRIWR